jgi:hypothetical protein
LRHVSAHDPSPRRYIKGVVGDFTVYQLVPSAASIADLLCLLLSCIAPKRALYWMRVKHLATKNTMAKTSVTNWVRSTITKKEVEKARADGLIAAQDSIQFPSTERIPKPPSGYRVMFLAFLLHGFSLPAHEFLRGLLFVYGVQLHQLTPNSLLHIACFVTLCESFLGIEPHFLLWRSIF